VLGGVVALLGGGYLALGSQPVLRWALEQAKGAGFDVQAAEVGGNLLSGVTAREARVSSAFVNGTAKSVTARYDLWTLLTQREVRLSADINGGRLEFDPGKLSQAQGGGGAAPPVTVALSDLRLEDTQVKVYNRVFGSPDVRVTMLEQSVQPGDTPRGTLKLALSATGGTGTANVRYGIGKNFALNLTADADLDARIARYWYEPIRAGRVKGTFNLTPQFWRVQARVENGVLEPLPGLFVRDVNGRANVTADEKVSALLTGNALGGAVEADIGVDIRGERWSVLATATPTVSAALEQFAPGVVGTGWATVTVRGGGWERVDLRGAVTASQNSSVAGFPVRDLRGQWSWTDRLRLTATANSSLLNETVRVTGDVATRGERVIVNARGSGRLLQAPLEVNANISALNGVTDIAATGNALRGRLEANARLNGERITGTTAFTDLKLPVPFASSLTGAAKASGTTRDLNVAGTLESALLRVPGVRRSSYPGAFNLDWNGRTLAGNANLGAGALEWRGALTNTDGADATGTLAVRDLALEPAGVAAGDLRYTLAANGSGRLEGVASARSLNLQGFALEDARGPLRLVWNGSTVNGRWDADRALITLTERAVRVQPKDWRLEYGGERLALAGDFGLEFAGSRFSGEVTGRGGLGELRVIGRGETLGIGGDVRYEAVRLNLDGSVDLEPLSVRATARPSSTVPGAELGGALDIRFDQRLRVSGTLETGGGRRATINYDGARLSGSGEVNLGALDAALPANSRGLLRGVARLNGSSAQVTGVITGIPLTGTAVLEDAGVTADARITGGEFAGVRVRGQAFPTVDATATLEGVSARVTGGFDDLRFTAAGAFPRLATLERSGVSLRGQAVTATGRFSSGALRASGRVGALDVLEGQFANGAYSARLAGDARFFYEGRPLRLTGVRGTVSGAGERFNADLTAAGLEGGYANTAARLTLEGRLGAVSAQLNSRGGGLTGTITARAANLAGRVDDAPVRARGFNLAATLNGSRLEATFNGRALEGEYAGARARLEGVAGTVTNGEGATRANLQASSGTAVYGGERLELAAVSAGANLSGSRVQTAFATRFGGRVRGEALGGKLEGTLGLDSANAAARWDGNVTANASGADWRVSASGPWSRVRVDAVAPSATLARLGGLSLPANLETTLRAQGFVALPAVTYTVSTSSAIGTNETRLVLNADINGVQSNWQARGTLRDAQGGTGTFAYDASSRGALRAQGLRLDALTNAATTVTGNLELRGERITGSVSGEVAGFPANARWNADGSFTGAVGGALPLQLEAVRWDFPLAVTPIRVTSNVDDLPLEITGAARLEGLRFDGQVQTRAYSFEFPGGGRAELLPRTYALAASAQDGVRLRLEDGENAIAFDGKSWGGGITVPYRTWGDDAELTMTAAGELTNPTLNVETRGNLNLIGSASLSEMNFTGSLALAGFTRVLEPALRERVTPGRLGFTVRGKPDALAFTAQANSARVDGEAVRLTLEGTLGARVSATGELALGSSSTRFALDSDGLRAIEINLDLRLARLIGVDASGTLRGALNVPQYRLIDATGALEVVGVRAFGASLDGRANIARGALSADLRGALPGELAFAVNGDLYPVADASVALDGLRGRFTGSDLERRTRRANLQLDGTFQGKASSLSANLENTVLRVNGAWDALRATLSGRASEDGVRLTGTASASDLRGIAGVAGSVNANLELNGAELAISNLRGNVAGYAVAGAARYADGALTVTELTASGADLSARASGRVLPTLEANATVQSRNRYAPGEFKATATGTLEKPVVSADGTLDAAQEGLIAPGTRVTARLEDDAWRVALAGEAVTGEARGTLEAVNEVRLSEVNAPVRFGDTRLEVRGGLGWTRASGFAGNLTVSGALLGSAATATLEGRGELQARLAWRSGTLRATLPAQITERADATLSLERFDIGALWGKPERLRVAGDGRVTGAWTNPSATFAGAVTSSDGSLDSRFTVNYAGGDARLALRGERVSLTATLQGSAYRAEGRFDRARLEALLPFTARLLEVSGDLRAEGELNAAGLPRVELSNVDLRGDLEPVGEFSATGTATLNRTLLAAQLNANVLGGTVRATGRIGNASNEGNVSLAVQGLNFSSLGVRGRANAQLNLSGAASDPNIGGTLQLEGLGLPGQAWGANAALRVSERLLNPSASGTATLTGTAQGQLQVQVSDALSSASRLSVRGTASIPEGRANIDLSGAFPRLAGRLEGSVSALPERLRAFTLIADGAGGYALQNAALNGTATLEAGASPLETRIASGALEANLALGDVIAGATGRVAGTLNLGGTLGALEARFAGATRDVALSGVSAPNAQLSATVDARGISVRLEYAEGAAVLNDGRVSVTGLPLRVGDVTATVNATGGIAPPDLTYTAGVRGAVTGNVSGRYANEVLEAQLEGDFGGVRVRGAAQGSRAQGWAGSLTASGLPAASLLGVPSSDERAGTVNLQITGAFENPSVTGAAQVLGGRLEVAGALQPLRVTLTGVRAPSATNGFGGTLELSNDTLSGALEYVEGALRARAVASGTLAQPQAQVTANYARASATAQVSLQNGAPRASITLSDGVRGGAFTFADNRLSGDAQGFDLSSLEAAGYGGNISLRADLRLDAGAPLGVRGTLETVWQSVVTPLEVPLLGWRVDGTGRGSLDTERGAVLVEYRGTPGTARANLSLQNGLWTGEVSADLRGAEGKGSIQGALRLRANGVIGDLNATSLPLELVGVALTVNGAAKLEGEQFSVSGAAQTLGGQITISGSGGISDLVPALQPYTRTTPGDLGYSLRARLDTVKLEDIAQVRAAAPGLRGRAIGVVQVTDGATSFQISVPELSLPDVASDPQARVRLGLRVTGTAVGSSLRYNGRLVGLPPEGATSAQPFNLETYGESLFNGSVEGSRASGLLEMRRAPLHSVVGAAFGALPGRAVATGIARYDIPLNDAVNAQVRAALERLEIEGGGDRLIGNAALSFQNGNLVLDSLDLRGKGRWTGSGRYTRDAVDLKLDFENTSFTPVLALVPNLRDYNPEASGTVKLRLTGRYALPDADLEVANLDARLSGIPLRAETLTGSLKNGDLRVSGTISSDETLGATLQTTATARVASLIPTNITNLEARAQGSLNVRPVGLIEDVNARVYGESGGFKLQATGRKGGALEVSGDLSPVLNVRLTGRNLIVPIPEYFVSDSLLDADLSFRGDGGRAYILGGNINLQRLSAALNQGTQTPRAATTAGASPSSPASARNPFLEQIKLAGIRVSAPQGLRVNESFAALEAGGTLTLTGTAAAPEASGTLEALGNSGGRGTLRLGVNTYTIQTAVATFSPVEGIFPVVNISAQGQVRAQLRPTTTASAQSTGSSTTSTAATVTQTITVNLQIQIRWVADASGARKLELTPTITAEQPSGYEPLSASELYSLVTLGSSSLVSGNTLSGIGQQALDTAFGYFFLSEFSRQFKAATGVDLAISTNLFDYIFNPNLSEAQKNELNFTFNFGFDLSRAVRFNLEVQTSGRGAVNLNYQSDDGRFGIRFNTPFDLNATPSANEIFGGLQPELSFSYNISSLNAFTLGFQYRGNNNFSIRLGFSFRF
jgi:hypothetical protein